MRSAVCGVRSPLRWWWLLKAQLRWCSGHQLSRSLLPEVELDILRCLDRFDLDAVQFSSPQLRNFLAALATHLPIRRIDEAVLILRECELYKKTYVIARNGRRRLRISTTKSSIEDRMCFVMKAIQNAYIEDLQLHCGGAGPLAISEELQAMIVDKARNVTVGWLGLTGWAFPDGEWPLAELFAIATGFPKVEIVCCADESPTTMYECALRGYTSKGYALPDVLRDGCCFYGAADAGVRGYCFCVSARAVLFLMDVDYTSKQFLMDEFVSGFYIFAREPAHIFMRRQNVPAEQYDLEKYASKRVPSTTNDHVSFFFDESGPADDFLNAFKAQICLHDGCLTFRYTSDPSQLDEFLVCKGTPKANGA